MTSKPIILIILFFLFVSCGSNKEQDAAVQEDEVAETNSDTTAITVSDTTKFKFDFAMANIPSPASSMQELGTLNVPYDNSMLNGNKNAVKYVTEFQRAMNLGVYNIDMVYAMMNDKGQDVLQYMKSIMIITEGLGLRNAVGTLVGKRAEDNLDKKDSLFKIFDEIFIKSDSYLRTNERLYTATVIFAGSWLESLYLNCKISGKTVSAEAKEKARKILWEQRFHLGNLTKVLKDYRNKKENAQLISGLSVILDELMLLKRSSDLNDDKFNSISTRIFELRNKIIS